MKTVTVKAVNLRAGDIFKGQRIQTVQRHPMRGGLQGVVILAPNPKGYALDAVPFKGNDKVVIKRPKHNYRTR